MIYALNKTPANYEQFKNGDNVSSLLKDFAGKFDDEYSKLKP